MQTFKMKFHTPDDIKRFVDFVSKKDFDIDVSVGHYTVDAKSILGVMQLDISKELTVTLHCTNEESKDFYDNFQNLLDR